MWPTNKIYVSQRFLTILRILFKTLKLVAGFLMTLSFNLVCIVYCCIQLEPKIRLMIHQIRQMCLDASIKMGFFYIEPPATKQMKGSEEISNDYSRAMIHLSPSEITEMICFVNMSLKRLVKSNTVPKRSAFNIIK